jgi:membrane-associated phospholipid phosphatase
MKKKTLLLLAFFLLLIFSFFTVLVHFNLFKNTDTKITILLQNLFPRSLDVIFSIFSLLGSVEIVVVIILILSFLYKKLNYIYVLIFFAIFHIVELLGKIFVNHPGPISKFFRYDFSFAFPSSSLKPGSSYPSGHLGRTLFICVILIFIIANSKRFSVFQKKLLYCFIVAIVVLMFISRIYLGEHWFSDVIGGSFLGAAMAFFSLIVY